MKKILGIIAGIVVLGNVWYIADKVNTTNKSVDMIVDMMEHGIGAKAGGEITNSIYGKRYVVTVKLDDDGYLVKSLPSNIQVTLSFSRVLSITYSE